MSSSTLLLLWPPPSSKDWHFCSIFLLKQASPNRPSYCHCFRHLGCCLPEHKHLTGPESPSLSKPHDVTWHWEGRCPSPFHSCGFALPPSSSQSNTALTDLLNRWWSGNSEEEFSSRISLGWSESCGVVIGGHSHYWNWAVWRMPFWGSQCLLPGAQVSWLCLASTWSFPKIFFNPHKNLQTIYCVRTTLLYSCSLKAKRQRQYVSEWIRLFQ